MIRVLRLIALNDLFPRPGVLGIIGQNALEQFNRTIPVLVLFVVRVEIFQELHGALGANRPGDLGLGVIEELRFARSEVHQLVPHLFYAGKALLGDVAMQRFLVVGNRVL